MKISIIMPVYNEAKTILEILSRVKKVNLGEIKKEIIIVDDCSRDGTKDILQNQVSSEKYLAGNEENISEIKIVYHSVNQGKGAAVSTGLKQVSGDCVIIQDADLEYNPDDYNKLLAALLKDGTDVVYGSRFLENKKNEFHSLIQYWGNRFVTYLTNLLYKVRITDMETCYKLFKREVILNLKIESKHFDFEPEVTAKILKQKWRVVEVPISYKARGYKMGKKINFKDGIFAVYCLIKYKFVRI